MQKASITKQHRTKKFSIPIPAFVLLLIMSMFMGGFLNWFFTYPKSECVHLIAGVHWIYISSAKVEPNKASELLIHTIPKVKSKIFVESTSKYFFSKYKDKWLFNFKVISVD